MLQFYLTASVV